MTKKIFIIGLLLVLSATIQAQTTQWNVFGRPTSDWFSSADTPRNIPLKWMRAVDPLIAAGAGNSGTGNFYYVDSNVAVAGDGSSWSNAKATLDAAIALCSDDNGDVIYVAQGHAEDWTTTDSVDVDVIGVTIIGCGTGSDAPTFTFDDTDPELVIGAANTYIYNLRFLPSVTAVVHAIEIEADADGSVIDSCWFMDGETAATDEFIDAIQPAALADNITVKNCRFESYTAAGANTAIDLTAGVHSDWAIVGNYFNGDYAEAPIYNDNDVDLRILVQGNVVQNSNAGEYGIEFGGAATGVIVMNQVVTDNVYTSIDPGSCRAFENYVSSSLDDTAIIYPTPVPSVDEAVWAYFMNSVAGSAMPIRIWYVDANISSSGTGTTPATAFKTIAEAITASSNSTDDWIFVFDYSGGGSTISINKAFVHLIGNANKAMAYPRIKPASAVDGIEITAAGDRVEIANLVIGGGDGTVDCISIDSAGGGGAYGVYIHDCVIGRDADAPGLVGIHVPAGAAAPYLYIENNRFYGADGAGIAAAGSGIRITGNATRCTIKGNYFQDIGRTATPCVWLDGAVTNPSIMNNMFKTDTDTGTGSAITLGASVDDGWIANNWASDGKDDPGNSPFADGGSTNGWSGNIDGNSYVLP